jgi:hypothetical protein
MRPPLLEVHSVQIGDGELGRIQVKHLPPVSMHLQLPHGYPKDQAPQISITAAWLSNSQVEQIVEALSRIAECSGECSCYSLVSWLQEDLLQHLGMHDCLHIPNDERVGATSASPLLLSPSLHLFVPMTASRGSNCVLSGKASGV